MGISSVVLLDDVAQKQDEYLRYVATGPVAVHGLDSLVIFAKDTHLVCPAPLICLPRAKAASSSSCDVSKGIREVQDFLAQYGVKRNYFFVESPQDMSVYHILETGQLSDPILVERVERHVIGDAGAAVMPVLERSERLYKDILSYRAPPSKCGC